MHGIKEGVVAVDLARRVTMVNDHAARMLQIPQLSTGRHVVDVDPSGRLADIFGGDDESGADPARHQTDRVLPVGERLVILNRRPVVSRGRHIGWVATLRDRTELLALQRELDLNRSTTQGLRAQAHEFSNRMHIVSGLIALGEFDGVRAYIRQISQDATTATTAVEDRVGDPAVAALLVAKSSQAAERGVQLVIDPATRLGRLDAGLAADVNTVIGNLLDNAVDAAVDAATGVGSGPARDAAAHQAAGAATGLAGERGRSAAQVRVEVVGDEDVVVVTVRDTGPGVQESLGDLVFARGFSTKDAKDGAAGDRGIGLALVRLVCRNRGGDVVVHNEDGAVFVAALPVERRARADGIASAGAAGGERGVEA